MLLNKVRKYPIRKSNSLTIYSRCRDRTGNVPAVDTQVAQHILKTVMAAQLMGAQCIISGIRPQIAQTIVSLGIEFGDIVTKANLSDALQHALKLRGVEIVRRAAKPAV